MIIVETSRDNHLCECKLFKKCYCMEFKEIKLGECPSGKYTKKYIEEVK